ncbi:fibronectin type III domain-containing protein [Paenibacillus oceani]|uniref:Fibronectin type III domain-containing protein n=1 Tax=Paenibacillus oceani TaxID=2772510 RepID=A0A927C6X6_9BACL|nr:fibronectin type III domain-containing protein [Paenibacillus oceani]MBD2862335.1 fibronectin type III domain-containing protein [Paenibacillus oceani]
MGKLKVRRKISVLLLIAMLVQMAGWPGLNGVIGKANAAFYWNSAPNFAPMEGNQVQVYWDPPYDTEDYEQRFSYEVKFYSRPGLEPLGAPGYFSSPEQWEDPGTFISTRWIQTGMDPAVEYEVRVMARKEGETDILGTKSGTIRLQDTFQYYAELAVSYEEETNQTKRMKLHWKPSVRPQTTVYSLVVRKVGTAGGEWSFSDDIAHTPGAPGYDYSVSGLQPGQSYDVQLAAFDAAYNIELLETRITVPGGAGSPLWPPDAQLTVSGLTDNGFTIEWPQGTGDVAAYGLSYGVNGGAPVSRMLGILPRGYTFTGLSRGDLVDVAMTVVGSTYAASAPLLLSQRVGEAVPLSPKWPAGASLSVSDLSQEGFSVNWPKASGGVTEYKLSWAKNGGAPVEQTLAAVQCEGFPEVCRDRTKFTFGLEAGLEAGDRVGVSVKAVDGAGRESEPLALEQGVLKLEFSPQSVGLYGKMALKAGEPLGISLQTTNSGYEASVSIQYDSWIDGNGDLQPELVKRELEVGLTESPAEPGLYTADWIVAESLGIERIEQAVAVLKRSGTVISSPVAFGDINAQGSGSPYVTGNLKLDIEGDVSNAFVWVSPSNMSAFYLDIPGPGSYSFTQLFPGMATVQLKDKVSGVSLLPDRSVQVKGSQTVREPMNVDTESTELRITVQDDAGVPVPGVRTYYRIAEKEWRSAITDDTGRLRIREGVAKGDPVSVKLSRIPLHLKELLGERHLTLTEGLNEEIVTLERGKLVMLSGQVTRHTGPIEGFHLTVSPYSGNQDNKGYVRQLQTDANGRYAVQVFAGVELRINGYNEHASLPPLAVVVGDTDVQQDLTPVEKRPGTIRVTVKRQNVDGSWIVHGESGIASYTMQSYEPVLTYVSNGQRIDSRYYPFNVSGKPGDEFRLCMRYNEYKIDYSCKIFTLDDNREGHVEFSFAAGGGMVRWVFDPTLMFQPGMPWNSGWMYRVTSANGRFDETFFFPWMPRFSFSEYLPAGEYTVLIYHAERGLAESYSRTFTIRGGEAGDQEVQIDLFRERMNPATKGASFAVSTMDAVPGDSVDIRAEYTRSPDVGPPATSLTETTFEVALPAGGAVVPGSVLVDEKPLASSLWTVQDGKLVVKTGSISFYYGRKLVRATVKLPVDYPDRTAVLTGTLRYTAGSESGTLSLGQRTISVAPVTLEAPDRTKTRELLLQGRATAGSNILIYEREQLLGQTRTADSGVWQYAVELPDRGVNYSYQLSAVAEINGLSRASDAREVIYTSVGPRLTKVTLSNDWGFYHSFDPNKGISKFPFLLEPGNMFIDLEFDEPDAVSEAIVSLGFHREGAYRTESGIYRSLIKVVNMEEITGPLYVSYHEVPADSGIAPRTETELRQTLAWWLRDADIPQPDEVETVRDGSGKETYSVSYDLPSRLGSGARAELSLYAETSVAYDPAGKPRMSVNGRTLYGASGSAKLAPGSPTPFPSAPTGYRDSAEMVRSFIRSDQAKNMSLIAEFSAYVRYEQAGGGNVKILSAPAEIAKTGTQILVEGIDMGLTLEGSGGFESTLDSIQERIKSAYARCSSHSAHRYHNAYEDIMGDMMAAESAKWVASLGLFAIGAGAPGPGTLIAGLTAVAGQGLGKVIDKEMSYELAEIDRAVDRDIECEPKDPNSESGKTSEGFRIIAKPTWLYDPSGYVYEAVPEERLEGVKATVMQWDEAASAWTDWDAEWFLQQNPQVTDRSGKYRWDVPPGRWKVRYEKDGYETVYSHEMTVLPPHFDVNIAMTSTTAPVVSGVRSENGGRSVDIVFSKHMRTDGFPAAAVQVKRGGALIAGVLKPVAPAADGALAKLWSFEPEPGAGLAAGDRLEVTVKAGTPSYNGLATAYDQTFLIEVMADDRTPPDPATNVRVTPGHRKLIVTWNDPEDDDLESMLIEWKETSGTGYRQLTVGKGVGLAELVSLQAWTDYEIRIVAVDAAGNRSDGAALREKPGLTAGKADLIGPSAVIGASAAAGTDQITIAWSDPADPDLNGVLVNWRERGKAEDDGGATVVKGQQRYTIIGLQPGRTYEIRLMADDESGNRSEAVVLTTATSGSDTGTNPGGSYPNTGPGAGTPPGTPPAVTDGAETIKWRDLFLGNTYYPALGGRLLLRAEGPQTSSAGNYELAVREASDVRWPADIRFIHAAGAFELGISGDWLPHSERILRIRMSIDEEKWEQLDRRLLAIYRADPDKPGTWHYAGGRWDPDSGRLEAVIGQPGVYAVMAFAPSFVDLAGHWSEQTVRLLASRQLANGVDEGVFAPDLPVTRAELAAFLIRLLDLAGGAATGNGLDSGASSGGGYPALERYSDADTSAWYAPVLERAVQIGLLEGSGTKLRPNDPATREEAAVIAYRIIGMLHVPETGTGNPAAGANGAAASGDRQTETYADEELLSPWAGEAVRHLSGRGLVNGYPDGRFDPHSDITRAQAAQIIMNIAQAFGLL